MTFPYNYRRAARQDPLKKAYPCFDGPFAGETLVFVDGISAVFTVRGQTGFYEYGYWVQHPLTSVVGS